MKSLYLLVIVLFCSNSLKSQEITMFPGFWSNEYYQDDNKITKKELNILMAKNEAINSYWKKSKTQEVISGASILAEFGFAVWMWSELINNDPFLTNRDKAENALVPAIGVLGTATIGLIFLHASNKSKKNAILAYNKQFDNKATFRLIPVSDQNGLGLALKF